MCVYIELFNGVKKGENPPQDNWGQDGPILGPLAWAHTIHGCELRACPVGDYDGVDITIVDCGAVLYDGVEYADWTIAGQDYIDSDPEFAGRIEQVTEEKAKGK